MACCRTMLRSFFFLHPNATSNSLTLSSSLVTFPSSSTTPNLSSKFRVRVRDYNGRAFVGRSSTFLNCSNGDTTPSSSHDEQGPPQEAVLKAISEVSKAEGRVGQTTNVVIGGTVSDDSSNEWLVLDKKVNSYPTVRGFTAIGSGGDDFVQAMVVAVESVVQEPIPEGRVKHKLSSGGKYISVNIGPIQVVSSEQALFMQWSGSFGDKGTIESLKDSKKEVDKLWTVNVTLCSGLVIGIDLEVSRNPLAVYPFGNLQQLLAKEMLSESGKLFDKAKEMLSGRGKIFDKTSRGRREVTAANDWFGQRTSKDFELLKV